MLILFNKEYEVNDMQKKDKDNKYVVCMIFGICIGTTLGIVFDHTILGMALGLGVGVFVGSVIANKNNKKRE